ncbi:ArsR/SmtB family transcription factor [Streptomonospora salina]|uniref:DNA-binding transcriptional ArsR family regulator n=1 Tax=Streptomonospora salina TaxID=104205 RepID=A0A841EBJ6_9ACTN|nr:winged helix-turn-helix domain-containing protein [Streptomonospora salina]MBB6000515.1 DNA-binding transcriptional ArsR family regulator [Streptomonospora salina]
MLRIHFASADIARTRVALAPDPMWEALLSMHVLQAPGGARYAGWRAEVGTRLDRRGWALTALAPPRGSSADFLTPAPQVQPAAHDVDSAIRTGIDAVRATPVDRLRADVERMAGERALPAWARRLGEGDSAVLDGICGALADYCRTALVPWWPAVDAAVGAARERHSRVLTHYGVAEFLARLPVSGGWRGDVLDVRYPRDRDLYLRGRGLLVLPSYFCLAPVTLCDPDRPPVLVLPVPEEQSDARVRSAAAAARPDRLRALFGRTRAAVLAAVTDEPTTSEVAALTGVSAAAASQHLGTLRASGLVTTRRAGCCVRHSLTALGRCLLSGEEPGRGRIGSVRPD